MNSQLKSQTPGVQFPRAGALDWGAFLGYAFGLNEFGGCFAFRTRQCLRQNICFQDKFALIIAIFKRYFVITDMECLAPEIGMKFNPLHSSRILVIDDDPGSHDLLRRLLLKFPIDPNQPNF